MKRFLFGISVNKFFALVTSGLALLCLALAFTLELATLGSGALNFSNIWNYGLLFITFIVLIMMNARNDDRAYLGIFFLIFFIAFDGLYGIGSTIRSIATMLASGSIAFAALELASMALWAGQLGLGVALYILLARYRVGRTSNFKLVRLLMILFLIAFALTTAWSFISAFLLLAALSPLYYVALGFYYGSQLAGAVCCLFTLNRLRRL